MSSRPISIPSRLLLGKFVRLKDTEKFPPLGLRVVAADEKVVMIGVHLPDGRAVGNISYVRGFFDQFFTIVWLDS